MALSETKICNAALNKIGAKRINNLTDGSVNAIACTTHYEMTRDSLLRSHFWRFASARKTLVEDTVAPDFEWDNQFILPTDFMAMKSIYEGRFSSLNIRSYALEGKRLLTNEGTMEIRYIKKVTDVTKFDPLFVEVLVLQLALKLVGALAGGEPKLQKVVQDELIVRMRAVRALDGQETNTAGQDDLQTWNDARYA